MKKKISILLCVVLATFMLASCASGAGGAANTSAFRYDTADYSYAEPHALAPAEAPKSDSDSVLYGTSGGGSTELYYNVTDDGGIYEQVEGETGVVPVSATAAEAFVEKIIYSVYADIETIAFDETIDKVYAMMQNYGAFIENSSISGVNYSSRMHGWVEFRYAHFSLRVPKENLDGITSNLNDLGNVTHRNSNAANITSQFYDTQSRLNSLRVQEERLLDMLSKAADVPDLIMIEERLSDVRYQVESLTTTLNNWQNQVDFSTLTINIREVEEYTEPTLIHRTYWQQIGDGFMATMKNVGKFFMDLFRWIIVSAPVLIILVAVGVAIFIIIRRTMRKMEEKKKSVPPKTYPAYVYQPPQPYQQNVPQTAQTVQTQESAENGSAITEPAETEPSATEATEPEDTENRENEEESQ